ncbi:MAG TPA: A/G-specific adenine glycosylase [Planctomycetaceae bacterium]|nr:A/G-specific adenine glycosylase [Planctomycetaceae bacterium]
MWKSKRSHQPTGTAKNSGIDSARKRKLRTAVLKWYDTHRRRLPWRESADPYRIWLSEIMLQQTTIAAVVPYFERFTEKFPDVATLARADVDDVLRLWEGLGYYSRARNLHKAAQTIMRDLDGQFPRDAESLQKLPGIGRYTAGAICSFAYDQPVPIVEANTERLYARLIALADDVRSTASQRTLWNFAAEIVPNKRPGDFNQALMDIGSTICRPQDPDCDHCPLVACCAAFANGLQHKLPRRKARVAVTSVDEICVVVRRKDQYLLRRRTEEERWAGMWDFVRFEIDDAELLQLPFATLQPRTKTKSSNARNLFASSADILPETIQRRVLEQVGLGLGSVIAATEFTYSVTRYRVRLMSFLCDSAASIGSKLKNAQWFSAAELAELPLSRTGRQVVEWLEGRENRVT